MIDLTIDPSRFNQAVGLIATTLIKRFGLGSSNRQEAVILKNCRPDFNPSQVENGATTGLNISAFDFSSLFSQQFGLQMTGMALVFPFKRADQLQ